MSLRDARVLAWEARLKDVFDRIDHELEEKYGDRLPLHPMRPVHGETANPAASGLFEIGAAFSAGYGSQLGRGYIVSARLATLTTVAPETREQLASYVADRLRALLPEAFPGQDLRVERDGRVFKIVGDLGL
jgi:hypothetical protein